MKDRLEKLLCVKSLVTLILTLVFSILCLNGKISGEQFLVIFTSVIAFYFGTQHERTNKEEVKHGTNDQP